MSLATIYLYLNAALYAGFALWCTLKYSSTARSLGYTSLDASGHSEYLVIYGGLQCGLAILFFLLGGRSEYHELGGWVSLGIYAPIVLYRWSTIAIWRPVSGLTLAVALLETLLLVGAVALVWQRRLTG